METNDQVPQICITNNIPRRNPTNGTFELTGQCNLYCKMCLIRVNDQRMKESDLRERTAAEWIDMAQQVFDAGTIGLLLTGGEVMLRPDFPEIYEAIAQMGFLLTVYTNATMVTDQIIKLWRKYPPHKIGVTMYGASNRTYKKLCGCPDGYDRFVDGVRRLSELPSLLDIRTTIVQDNLSDLQAMKDYVAQTLGADKPFHISRTVWNTVRGGIASPRKTRLTPEQNVALVYPWLTDLREKYKAGELRSPHNGKELHLHRYQSLESGQYLFSHCQAGITEYTINWSGRMYACEMAARGFTEPFNCGFQKAWAELPEQYPLNQTIPKCQSCTYAGLCEVCPAIRMAETGDWFGIPDYCCQEAKTVYKLVKTFSDPQAICNAT